MTDTPIQNQIGHDLDNLAAELSYAYDISADEVKDAMIDLLAKEIRGSAGLLTNDKPKTKRVRIACVINGDGNYNVSGWQFGSDEVSDALIEQDTHESFDPLGLSELERLVWIEADVPLPVQVAQVVVEGEVMG